MRALWSSVFTITSVCDLGNGVHLRVLFWNMGPDMLRGDELVGFGSSYGGNAQHLSRGWEIRRPVWLSCYEYVVVTLRLKHFEGLQGNSDQNGDMDALWRKRGELAQEIVDADALTIQDLLLKVSMTASLLSKGEVGVVLTPQCMEECDRALTQDGDGEQCLKTLEPELWALCERVHKQTAAIKARWDCAEQSEEGGRLDDPRDGFSLATGWAELHESVWSVARYETMTTVGLKAKGKIFSVLLDFFSAMECFLALQESYLRDFGHLVYRRLNARDLATPRRSVG